MDIDLTEDLNVVISDAKLSQISMLGLQAVGMELEIKRIEQDLKEKKERLFKLTTETLPLAMDEVELTQFQLSNGYGVTIQPFMEGSIPAANPAKPETVAKHNAAIGWLRDNGHEGIIRREVSLAFKKGQDQLAERVLEALQAIPEIPMCGVEIEDQQNVHHMTLKSWAKEMQEENLEFPAETLGLFVGRRAKVAPIK